MENNICTPRQWGDCSQTLRYSNHPNIIVKSKVREWGHRRAVLAGLIYGIGCVTQIITPKLIIYKGFFKNKIRFENRLNESDHHDTKTLQGHIIMTACLTFCPRPSCCSLLRVGTIGQKWTTDTSTNPSTQEKYRSWKKWFFFSLPILPRVIIKSGLKSPKSITHVFFCWKYNSRKFSVPINY